MEKKTAHLTVARKQKQKEKLWGFNISFMDTSSVNQFSFLRHPLLKFLLLPNNIQFDSQLFST